MRVLVGLIALFVVLSGSAQIKFHRVFSDNGYDFGQGITQLADSSYYVTGSSSSFFDGPSQAFLLKLNKFGEHQWAKHYGGAESDWGRRVYYKEDYGVLLAGYTNSSGNGSYDFYLVKTDPSGELLWEQTYGTSAWEKLNDAWMTRDTGLIMVGESLANGLGSRAYAVCVDQNGDEVWTLTLPNGGDERFTSIHPLNDSLYFIGGQRYDSSVDKVKGFILLIHENGTIIWERFVGDGNAEYGINGLDVVNDEVSFVGYRVNPDNGLREEFMGRVNDEGDIDFQFFVGSADNKNFQFIKAYNNNASVFITYQIQDGWGVENAYDVITAKFAYSLLYWEGAYVAVGYPDMDEAGQLIRTNDGSVAFVGYTSHYGNGGGNVFVTKIGPNEDFPTVTPQPTVFSLVEIDENTIQGDLSLYPNPVRDILQIKIPNNEENYSYSFLETSGRQVKSGSLAAHENLIQVDDLDSGCYVLIIRSASGGIYTAKILVQ